MKGQLKLDEWQARERAAVEAEHTLRGDCCGNCQHAGHLRLGGAPLGSNSGPDAPTVSCERPRVLWSGGEGGYWHDRSFTCEHWTLRRTP